MAQKKSPPLDLICSNEILKYPDGEIATDVLEDLLQEISERSLKKDQIVLVTYDQRVRNFDPEDPQWEEVAHTVSVRSLFRLYRDLKGEDYIPLTPEEKRRQEEAKYRRMARGY